MATNKGAELLESLKTQGLSQQEMLNRLDAIVDAESACLLYTSRAFG